MRTHHTTHTGNVTLKAISSRLVTHTHTHMDTRTSTDFDVGRKLLVLYVITFGVRALLVCDRFVSNVRALVMFNS